MVVVDIVCLIVNLSGYSLLDVGQEHNEAQPCFFQDQDWFRVRGSVAEHIDARVHA